MMIKVNVSVNHKKNSTNDMITSNHRFLESTNTNLATYSDHQWIKSATSADRMVDYMKDAALLSSSMPGNFIEQRSSRFGSNF